MRMYRYRTMHKNRNGIRFTGFNILLLILFLLVFVNGFLLRQLSTQLLLRRTIQQGINYDEFREMKLPDNILEQLEPHVEKLKKKIPGSKKEEDTLPLTYLTFSMFVNSFDLTNGKLAEEDLFLAGIGKIGSTSGFIRLRNYYKAVLGDIKYFPVPRIEGDTQDISYVDTWSDLRSYGGNRRHEGTDIMAKNNIRGYYPVISITEGVVEKMGWLEQGGYRIGIRSPSGGYFYYAHLNSYSGDLKKGDPVLAGQLLGFMGDSGYGKEGTTGQFDVHLHLGIYVETSAGELSVNPYHVLKILEKNRLTCYE